MQWERGQLDEVVGPRESFPQHCEEMNIVTREERTFRHNEATINYNHRLAWIAHLRARGKGQNHWVFARGRKNLIDSNT